MSAIYKMPDIYIFPNKKSAKIHSIRQIRVPLR